MESILLLPSILCGVLFLLLIFSYKKELPKVLDNSKQPLVSIFVAARNEEKTIVRCLEALSQLSYSNLEVFIGNDHSEDKTKELIQAFIKDKPQFTFVDVIETLPNIKGKSNVLAQLAQLAKGEFYFVTDADTKVPKHWVEGMLGAFKPETGIVTGITTLSPRSLFHKLQQIDWLYALHLVKVVSDLNLPVTSMGNNMAIRKEAYEQTGGYEKLPFSITEDFQLFKEVLKDKWEFVNLFNKDVLAESLPIADVGTLLHQRKRWMVGVFQLPWYFLVVLMIQALFYPLILFAGYMLPELALFVLLFKYVIQIGFIARAYHRIGRKVNVLALLLFEFYSAILSLSLLLFYVLPIQVNWKGRKYK